MSRIEEAAGNFGKAAELQNMAKASTQQKMRAMRRAAPAKKGPSTLPKVDRAHQVGNNRAASALV
jgi:hypothetical protein